MKVSRQVIVSVLCGVGFALVLPHFAAAQFPGGRMIVPGRGPGPGGPIVRHRADIRRGPAVVHPGWPLRRAPRPVIVRPPRGVVRPYVAPRVFLPAIVFGGIVLDNRLRHQYGYSRESLGWQDSETLYREDDWTEFTLDCNERGSKLWFEVTSGRLQVDWAEVVFANGEVQVVEFPERSLRRGLYELLDFRDGRQVDYVRMVAKASSNEAKLSLLLQR
jgi:hypothetical protein